MYMKRHRGITMIELLVTIAIVAILAALGMPSYQDMVERNRLKQAVEALKSDLQWMRVEAIKQSCNLEASFTNGANWSYQIYIPPAAAGTSCFVQHENHGCPAAATANCNIRTGNSTEFAGVSMGTVAFITNPATMAAFDFRRGEATRDGDPKNGRVEMNSANYDVKVVVAPVGRVRICSIAGSAGLSGYPDC
jgi:type IV fimbrial biogenesis protein FimT